MEELRRELEAEDAEMGDEEEYEEVLEPEATEEVPCSVGCVADGCAQGGQLSDCSLFEGSQWHWVSRPILS